MLELTVDRVSEIDKNCLRPGENFRILDLNRLESALGNQWAPYPMEEQAIASVFRSLIQNHPFENGNKRTAVIAMSMMADSIGVDIVLNDKELGDLVYKLADAGGSLISVNSIANQLFGLELEEKLDEARVQSAVKSNGVYSVLNDTWIKEPVKEDIPDVDQEALNKELGKWVDRYTEIVGDKEKSMVDVLESITDTKIYHYCGPIYRSGNVFKRRWCGYAEATTLDGAVRDLIEQIVIQFNLRDYDTVSIDRDLITIGNRYLSEDTYMLKPQRQKLEKEKAINDAIVKLADDDIKDDVVLGTDEYRVFEILCKDLGIEPNKYLFDLYLQRIADRFSFGESFDEDLDNAANSITDKQLRKEIIDELKSTKSSIESVLTAYLGDRYNWLVEPDKKYLSIVDTNSDMYVVGGPLFGLKLKPELVKKLVNSTPLTEESKPKIRYYYSGPVYNFEHVLRNPWVDYTEAVSSAQALNNLKRKFKKKFYGRADVWKKIDLDPKCLKVSPKYPEEDIDWKNVESESSKYCPECGTKLNDAGECPVCDLGDMTALEESYEDDKITEIENYIEDIYDLRKTSIAKDGEYGIGNLVFKEIRNLGYLDNLKKLKNALKSKKFSLEESKK